MILYHTSNREIRNHDIHHGRKNADFGWGFYLTPDREFAYRWARENAVINEYEFDESELDIKVFSRDVEWFEYIFNNRLWVDTLNVDVVIGPIANDTIFDTLGIITSGYLKSEDALQLLMIGPAYTQIAIKTEKAASQLKWIKSERVERPDKETLKKEQKAYEEVFGKALNEIMGYEE